MLIVIEHSTQTQLQRSHDQLQPAAFKWISSDIRIQIQYEKYPSFQDSLILLKFKDDSVLYSDVESRIVCETFMNLRF